MDRFAYRDHHAMKPAGQAPAHDPRLTRMELVRERQSAVRERQSAVREVSAQRPFFLQPFADVRRHWAGLLDDVARFDAEFFH